MIEKIEKYIEKIENLRIPWHYWLITVLSIIMIRIFVEKYFFTFGQFFVVFGMFLHFSLFYICILFATILLLRFLTKEKIEKIFKIATFVFIIIITPPILDVLICKNPCFISYLPLDTENILYHYLTFGGEIHRNGITPGLKIEVFIICMLSSLYIFIKTKNHLKSIFTFILIYSLIFFFASIPLFLSVFLPVNFLLDRTHEIMSSFYTLLLVILFYLFYINDGRKFFIKIITNVKLFKFNFCLVFSKKNYVEIIKNIRLSRLFYYQSMFLFGVYLSGILNRLNIFLNSLMSFLFLILSIIFAFLFSIGMNDIEDLKIDKISNKNRPLVKKIISKEDFVKLNYFFLILALFLSLLVNFHSFILISTTISLAFIYSMPPFKLKRIPIVSKLVFSLISLILIMLGYFLYTYTFNNFPKVLIPVFLVLFTLCINFIDIKDYEGDKKNKIYTIPTIFGLKNGKMIISFLFLISYILFPFFIGHSSLIPYSTLFAIFMFFIITKKVYEEKWVFIFYFLSILSLFFLISSQL